MNNNSSSDWAQFYALKLRHEIQRMSSQEHGKSNYFNLVLLALVSTIQKKLKGE